MERLSKFAIYLGMGIGVTIFALLLISVLPYILENSMNEWERLDRNDVSEEELHVKFAEHPAYVAMYERFPDAKEEFSYHGGTNWRMTVGVMNFESGNQLVLNMHHDGYYNHVEVSAYCIIKSDHDRRDGGDGLFTEDFIRNTDCLESAGDDKPVKSQGISATTSP